MANTDVDQPSDGVDIIELSRRYLWEYERRYGHSVPASFIRTHLFAAGFLAKPWLDRGVPNPEWEARAATIKGGDDKVSY
jgi:hypothetical protein